MPASSRLTQAVRTFAAANLLQRAPGGEEEIVDSYRNVRNWRRYDRTVEVGPEDERGCKRVTIEWYEDYEYEVVIVIETQPRLPGLGWGGGGFQLGGRRTYRIGWFEVKGERHYHSEIECPGDTGLASAGKGEGNSTTVAVNGEEIWVGDEAPLVAVVTGGTVAPVHTGDDGHLTAFVDWMKSGPPLA